LRTLDGGSNGISIDYPDGLQLHKCDRVLRIAQSEPDPRNRSIDASTGAAVSYNYRIADLSRDPLEVSIDEIGARFGFRTLQRRFVSDIRKAGLWVAFFDKDAVKLPITIRNFRPGDRFVPLGISGSQKVKQFFIDHKVPRHLRAGWPMVLGADEIIWVVGHRISDRVKLRSSTDTVLEVTCDLPAVG
jgi:tRNA(Ile)-lysidine synthase